MLPAQAAGGVTLQIRIEDGGAAALALPVGALVQAMERLIDTVEHSGRPGQFRFVAFLHGRAG